MADHHQQHPHGAPPGAPSRPTFAAPRLELPRFQFAPRAQAPAPASPPAPMPAPLPATTPAPQLFVHPPQAPRPAYARPQQVAYSTTHAAVAAPAPAPVAPAPQPAMRAATASPLTSSPTAGVRPASVAWSEPAAAQDRTLLQRITPVHMGVLLVLVVLVMVMTSGPAAMHAAPAKLPATVAGGGSLDAMLPPRSGIQGTPPATAAKLPATGRAARTPAPRASGRAAAVGARGARMLRVGTASVRANVTAGGIPSPAAAAQLAVSGGGRLAAGHTDSTTMAGMPSPAAAEKLGPEQLPFRPSDGVTLPRATGERDAHAVDAHYGTDSLPMEEPAAPVMTPGASAAHAERQVVLNELTGGTQSANPMPAAPAAGYATAY